MKLVQTSMFSSLPTKVIKYTLFYILLTMNADLALHLAERVDGGANVGAEVTGCQRLDCQICPERVFVHHRLSDAELRIF